MGSKDERIVQMTFDNQQFERGIAQSRQSLKDLDKSLQLQNATKGFAGISKAAENVDLSAIAKGVESLQNRFSMFGIMGMRVMEEIANAAIGMGQKLWSMTFGQIKSGGLTRAMNIENAQFMLEGLLKDEAKVNAVFEDAKNSVTGTAYSLDSAAKAASQFVASGMEAGEGLQTALRAIVGTAAMTNSEYEDISRIFTTVAGNGRLMGDQLLSLSSRGLNAAATLAEFFTGVKNGSKSASEEVTKYIKSISRGTETTEAEIRDFVSKGKISFEVFTAAMDEAFGEHALKANETLTGAFSNVKAALSRIGEAFYAPLIKKNGPLVEFLNVLRVKINDINTRLAPLAETATTAITNIIRKLSYLIKFVEFRFVFEGIGAGLKLIAALLEPIGKAFKDVFGEPTRQDINKVFLHFREFMRHLKVSEQTVKNIHNIFGGFFALLSIGAQIVGAVFNQLKPLGGIFTKIATAIGNGGGSLGEFLINLNESLKESDYFNVKFEQIKNSIIGFIDKIKEKLSKFSGVRDTIVKVWSDIKTAFTTNIDSERLSKLTELFDSLKGAITRLWDILKKFGGLVKEAFSNFYDGLDKASFATAIINGLTAVFQILAGALQFVIDIVIQLAGSLKKIASSGIENLSFDSILKLAEGGAGVIVLSKVASALNNFARSVDADTLRAVAKATLMLVAAIAILSFLDADRIEHSLGIITGVIGELIVAYNAMTGLFSKVNKIEQANKGVIGMIAMATGLNKIGDVLLAARNLIRAQVLITLAAAVLILVAAIAALAFIPEDKLEKAMKAITLLIAELVISFRFLSRSFKNNILGKMGGTILGFGAAILLLSVALIKLSKLDPDQLAQGITGLGAVLLELAIFMRLIRTSSFNTSSGIGLVALALAMEVFYHVIKKFGSMDTGVLAKGIIAVGAALMVIAIALRMMPGTTGFSKTVDKLSANHTNFVKIGVGLVIMAAAMEIFADVIQKLGSMTLEDVAKGLIGIGGAMIAFTIAFNRVESKGIIKKAAALVIVAASMEIFADVMNKMGSMEWEQIAKGLSVIMVSLAMATYALKALSGENSLFAGWGGISSSRQSSVLKAAIAITVVAAALEIFADVVSKFGEMNMTEIGKGLLSIFGVLAMATIALKVLNGKGLKSAMGIFVIAAALNVFVPAIKALGNMKLSALKQGILGLGAALVVLAVGGLLLKPVAGTLAKLGAAMLMFGVGAAALGVGVTLVVAALTALMAIIIGIGEGAKAIEDAVNALVSGLVLGLGKALDGLMNIVGVWLINLITYISEHGNEIIEACMTILRLISDAAAAIIPVILYTLGMCVAESLRALVDSGVLANIVDSLLLLAIQALDLLITYAPQITDKVVELICVVLDDLGKNVEILLDHTLSFIEKFLNGLAEQIIMHSQPLIDAVGNILLAITYFVVELLQEMLEAIGLEDFAKKLDPYKEKILDGFTHDEAKNAAEEWMEGFNAGAASKSDEILKTLHDFVLGANKEIAGLNKLDEYNSMNVDSEAGQKYLYGSGSGEWYTKALMSNDRSTREYAEKVGRMTTNVQEREQLIQDYMNQTVHVQETTGKAFEKTNEIRQKQIDHGVKIVEEGTRHTANSIAVNARVAERWAQVFLKNKDFHFGDIYGDTPIGSEWDVVRNFSNNLAKNATIATDPAQSARAATKAYVDAYNEGFSSYKTRNSVQKSTGSLFGQITNTLTNGDFMSKAKEGVSQAGQVITDKFGEYSQQFNNSGQLNFDEYINGFSDGTVDYEQLLEQIGDDGTYLLGSYKSAFGTQGAGSSLSYVNGIGSNIVNAVGTASTLAGNAAGATSEKDSLWNANGKGSGRQYGTGILAMMLSVKNTGSAIAAAGYSGAGSRVSQFYEKGQQAAEGFIRGMLSKTSAVYITAWNMAGTAVEALRAKLDVNSPSKVTMKLGNSTGEGYVMGIEQYMTSVKRVSEDLAEESLTSLQNGIEDIAKYAELDEDLAPSVRPIVDLTDVTNGITAMDTMFDESHAIAAQASFDMYNALSRPDYIQQFAKMSSENEFKMAKIIDRQTEVLLDIRTRLAHQQIVLDSGELVGATINKIDDALGDKMFRAERGN